MGKLKGDVQAPMQCVMDYEPCDKCKEQMSLGVTLIEVSPYQPSDGRPPLKAQGNADVYPLGRYAVVRAEAVKGMFNLDMTKGQKLFVDTDIMNKILGGVQ